MSEKNFTATMFKSFGRNKETGARFPMNQIAFQSTNSKYGNTKVVRDLGEQLLTHPEQFMDVDGNPLEAGSEPTEGYAWIPVRISVNGATNEAIEDEGFLGAGGQHVQTASRADSLPE